MTQLTLTPTIDSFIQHSTSDPADDDLNFGSSISIALGVFYGGGAKDKLRRAIANWDVTPVGVSATIDQVTMQRSITLADPTPHSVNIVRCTRPSTWTENGVTWKKYDGANPWTSGGGDYTIDDPLQVTFIEATETGIFTVSGLSQFVRDALDNRSGLVSLIIRNTDEVPPNTQRSVWLAQSFWKLIIDYTPSFAAANPVHRRDDPISVSGHRPHSPRAPAHPRDSRRPNAPRKGHAP